MYIAPLKLLSVGRMGFDIFWDRRIETLGAPELTAFFVWGRDN